MQLKKVIAPFAAALCVVAAAHAQGQPTSTNFFTFKATAFPQGTITDDGTNTTFASAKSISVATKDIISNLGLATTNNFSSKAKLGMIDGTFVVIDGATVVDVGTIIHLTFGENDIETGKSVDLTGVPLPSIKDNELVTINYDDTAFPAGNHTRFFLTGLATSTEIASKPKNGVITETFTAKIASMTGEGQRGATPFVATGSATASGKNLVPQAQ